MLSLEEIADLTRELLEVSRTAVDDPRRAEFIERKHAVLEQVQD